MFGVINMWNERKIIGVLKVLLELRKDLMQKNKNDLFS